MKFLLVAFLLLQIPESFEDTMMTIDGKTIEFQEIESNCINLPTCRDLWIHKRVSDKFVICIDTETNCATLGSVRAFFASINK